MTAYTNLDSAIVAAIKAGYSPLYERRVRAEAYRIGELTGRADFRITDGRIQALRKAGVICYLSKSKNPTGHAGWALGEKGGE